MTDVFPKVAAKTPAVLDLEPGTYHWCTCGLSAKQPFCDGAHIGSGMTPLKVPIDSQKKVAWCGCKATAGAPFCDGSHQNP